MKTQITILALFLSTTAFYGQVSDTVTVGAGYSNQVWYNLNSKLKTSTASNSWDIAFEIQGYTAAIRLNDVIGNNLYLYPNGNSSDWENVDITDIDSWPALYNSESNWVEGAFNANLSEDENDLGWGVYNTITHIVTGDSLYIIQLSDGNYKKLWIQNLNAGIYSFKYSNIDNSDLQEHTLDKLDYNDKNFGYFSLLNNTQLDIEPVSTEWDLLFTKYTGFIPTPYGVTGVLCNNYTTIAEGPAEGEDAGLEYFSEINTIGYDWKEYDFNSSSFIVDSEKAYFIQTQNGNIYKLIFTAFGGSSNGNFYFTTEQLSSSGTNDGNGKNKFSMAVSPNLITDYKTQLIFSNFNGMQKLSIEVFDLLGKCYSQENIGLSSQLAIKNMQLEGLKPGVYIISAKADNFKISQKIVVQ